MGVVVVRATIRYNFLRVLRWRRRVSRGRAGTVVARRRLCRGRGAAEAIGHADDAARPELLLARALERHPISKMSLSWNFFLSGIKAGATRLNRLQGVRRYTSLGICVEIRRNMPPRRQQKTRADVLVGVCTSKKQVCIQRLLRRGGRLLLGGARLVRRRRVHLAPRARVRRLLPPVGGEDDPE